jgi:hypothetical protein
MGVVSTGTGNTMTGMMRCAMSYDSNKYNEEEFLRTFCVLLEHFHKLVNVVRQHTNFMSVPGKRKKATVAKHLLVFLY